MRPALLPAWSRTEKPVIGMLHAPPLPGSPGQRGDFQAVIAHVLADARVLANAGVHGFMIENFGDTPFYPSLVPTAVVAHMTALAERVRRAHPSVPLGINVLRNDGGAALAIAAAVGAQFIRVNVLCGARVTDQGVIQGIAHDLLRLRASLGCDVKILADVDVKHSVALAPRPIEDEVHDTLERGLADAVIVSGPATGAPVNPETLAAVRRAAGNKPLFIGSGADAQSVATLREHANGFIVGSALKRGGVVTAPVDARRVGAFMRAVRAGVK